MKRHVKPEWLVFFGNPSHSLMPVFGLNKLWKMIMHLIKCQECSSAIPWPRPFIGNIGAAHALPEVPQAIAGLIPLDEFHRDPPAAPPNSPTARRRRRRYRRRIWGTRGWNRRRLDMTTGRRVGRLRRVPEGFAGLGSGWIEREDNNNDENQNDGIIGNALGE